MTDMRPSAEPPVVAEPAAPRLPAATQPLNIVKADLFKTLGHPARIRILEVLSDGDRTVAELLPLIGLEPSHLSQQLGILRRAGLVDGNRTGSTVTYTLTHPLVVDLLAVARELLRGVINDQIQSLAELSTDTAPS